MPQRIVNRRGFLKDVGVAGAVLGMGPLLTACEPEGGGGGGAGGDGPIRIGGMWLLSGALSSYGEFAREGARMAVEELNDNGGVLGREVEMLFEHEGDAESVLQVARRLALEENVDFLMGLDSSGTAQALVPAIPELGKVLMVTHAASSEITGELCNRYVFRCSVNVPQNSYLGAKLAAEEYPDLQTWGTIGPDYAFGYETWEFFSRYLQERNPEVSLIDPIYPPFPNEDFSSHINQALDARPDGLFISLWGADLVNFIRQAQDFGLFDQITPMFQLGAAMEVLEGLGDRMPTGYWAGTRYWWDGVDTETNKAFVDGFRERYDHPPSYNAQGAYTGVKLLAAAAEEAGSTEADPVIDALEGMELDAPQGPTVIRAEDHQALVEPTWGKLADSPDEDFMILDPVVHVPADEATPPVDETGCEME